MIASARASGWRARSNAFASSVASAPRKSVPGGMVQTLEAPAPKGPSSAAMAGDPHVRVRQRLRIADVQPEPVEPLPGKAFLRDQGVPDLQRRKPLGRETVIELRLHDPNAGIGPGR